MIESYLGTQEDRATDVLRRIQGVLRIFACDARTLPLLVIEEVGAKSGEELRVELTIYIGHEGILGRSTPQLSSRAESAVGAKLRRYRIQHVARHVRHIPLIHVPGLGRHVPL